MKIPARIVLPGNYVITVKMLPKSEMVAQHDEADGCWDVDTHTIYIGKQLRRGKQDYVFRHELIHAALDWALRHDYITNGWDKEG